jgi:hypothetical protein
MVCLVSTKLLERLMPTNIPIKNTNQANTLKVLVENLTEFNVSKGKETGTITAWTKGIVTYLKPGEATDLWIAENRRFTVTEMPT